MPCTVTESEARHYEEQHNKKRYGVEWSDSKLREAVACWLAKNIAQSKLKKAPPYVLGWIERHNKEDKQRETDEAKKRASELSKAKAIAKLTPHERKLLGLK